MRAASEGAFRPARARAPFVVRRHHSIPLRLQEAARHSLRPRSPSIRLPDRKSARRRPIVLRARLRRQVEEERGPTLAPSAYRVTLIGVETGQLEGSILSRLRFMELEDARVGNEQVEDG